MEPRVPDRPLLAIGDSILVGARDYGDLEARLADAGYRTEVRAESSRTVAWAIAQIEPREVVPGTAVVVLGSNPGPGLGAFPEEAAALVEALRARGARRIVWVPPHHAEPERYAERQAALRALERIEVLDWPAALAANPWWIGTDGLHLTGDGYSALASFIAEQLAAG